MDEKSFICSLKESAPHTGIVGQSVRRAEGAVFFIFGPAGERRLGICKNVPPGFVGKTEELLGLKLLACPKNHCNAARLRELFPFTRPQSVNGKKTTLGLGDRLGFAGGGHLKAIAGRDVFPVLAQQSKRELNLTGRTYESVADEAVWAVFSEGYEGGYAFDGDHLKTADEIKPAIAAGVTMVTVDCSEHIGAGARGTGEDLAEKNELERLVKTYDGKSFTLADNTEIVFGAGALFPIIDAYYRASVFIADVYHDILRPCPREISLEASLDETAATTSPEAHFFVASELKRRGVPFYSLAPRFCGEFQKGIDYIGNLDEFERQFRRHASVARHFGHRLSIHSGSDKFSVFPAAGRLSGGFFHLKTSGTSWVESLRVVAGENPDLFRRMLAFSMGKYEAAREFYHVSGEISKIPDPYSLADEQLSGFFDLKDSRQVMHITYGYILNEKDERGGFRFRDELYKTLGDHEELLTDVIKRHFERHLDALGVRRY